MYGERKLLTSQQVDFKIYLTTDNRTSIFFFFGGGVQKFIKIIPFSEPPFLCELQICKLFLILSCFSPKMNKYAYSGCPNKHGNSVTNSISSFK